MKLEALLMRAAEMGAIKALAYAGQMTDEISYAKAWKVYGRWFAEAVERGDLKPVRIGNGDVKPNRFFKVSEILAYQTTLQNSIQ